MGEIKAVDFDGKGKYELIRFVSSFAGFHALCNACSPYPEVIFSYDNKARRYVIANNKFADFILRDIEKDMKIFEEIDMRIGMYNYGNGYDEWLSKILKIFLDLALKSD